MSKDTVSTATKAQVRAARPDVSSWVSANAGSGKTRVLTNRVARLLLRGTEPAKILCLTFTKAAAAEMQNRLFKQLGRWAMLGDAELQSALEELGEAAPSGTELAGARTLFARALEAPGGLKIQTIHAFCESLLHRFPLEAGISPEFKVIDDRQIAELRMDVLNEMAEAHPQIYDRFVGIQSRNPVEFLPDILKNQQMFAEAFDNAEMASILSAEPEISEQDILHRVMVGLSDADILTLAQVMVATANPDAKKPPHQLLVASTLQNYKTVPVAKALKMLEAAFLTSGKPRSTKSFPIKAVKSAFPPAFDLVSTLINRVEAAREIRLANQVFRKSLVLHEFARLFLQTYTKRKSELGRLEFEDLIRKTESLLSDSDMAQWVLYRLDGGIDHILVDEAQDTSPIQWDIVAALAAEIYASADEQRPRTVFVVGDEKQSIFSFQGADPREFSRMKKHFAQQLAARGTALSKGDLLHSFRSAAPILQLVDQVFQGDAAAGLSDTISHLAADETQPGCVEIWPLLEKPDMIEKKQWYEPIDALPPGDPEIALANSIAERVAELIKSGHELPGKNRPVNAGDFLILLQSRKTLFHPIIKALKANSVPVAGADRLKVAEELAVKDLLACLQFANSPMDDLSLACALRSPLCGVSEAELFRLAHGRKGNLWPEIKSQKMLSDLLSRVDFARPYELLEHILIQHNGREKLLARLGLESQDGIDELLRQALEFEGTANPSLTGFLEWISAEDIEVKRRMDDDSGQVRVMTVHGAKGLEAPIVILPQTVKDNQNISPLVVPLGHMAAMGTNVSDAPDVLKAANDDRNQLRAEEKNRLLYVALTRAKTWLIIAGYGTQKKSEKDWYGVVREAAESCGATRDSQNRLVLHHNWSNNTILSDTLKVSGSDLPEWIRKPVAVPVKPAAPRSPSDLGGEHSVAGSIEDKNALTRGSQMHLLLENLVKIPKIERMAKARAVLQDNALDGVIAEALAVLDAPQLHHVFDKETLREAAISADIPGLGPVSGRIDVLIMGEVILAVDFKSSAVVANTPDDIPEAFLRQMAAYQAMLRQIWPEKPVKIAICWTRNKSLMAIPDNLATAALLRACEG